MKISYEKNIVWPLTPLFHSIFDCRHLQFFFNINFYIQSHNVWHLIPRKWTTRSAICTHNALLICRHPILNLHFFHILWTAAPYQPLRSRTSLLDALSQLRWFMSLSLAMYISLWRFMSILTLHVSLWRCLSLFNVPCLFDSAYQP